MRDLLKKLYVLAGSNGNHITRMLIFECLEGIFDSWSLGAILYLLRQQPVRRRTAENLHCQSHAEA